MKIEKSQGVTATERILVNLCEKTFLKLWSYPNPYKNDGKELCDLLVIFKDTAFIFFDREKPIPDDPSQDAVVSWERWKRRVIDAQIKTASGAERYLRSGKPIYINKSLATEVPKSADIPLKNIHKVIVAHGAAEACLRQSSDNIYGSLAICYTDADFPLSAFPFAVTLSRSSPVHVFDSHNLEIVLGELDTVWDLSDYLRAKLEAIERYDALTYCGEEDLLAHYLLNYDDEEMCHRIGPKDEGIDFLAVGEGEWKDFRESETYKNTATANIPSYLWDHLIQITAENALTGRILGDSPLTRGRSAIHEMAMEPRFVRRALAEKMFSAIDKFPEDAGEFARNVSLMPSFFEGKLYVFLQVRVPQSMRSSSEYRDRRKYMLQVACGAAKNRFPETKTIVGIAIDAPKFYKDNSEDFLLMDCSDWSSEDRRFYEEANEPFLFFQSNPTITPQKVTRFVPPNK